MAIVSYIPVEFRVTCKGCGGHNTEIELELDGCELLEAKVSCVCGKTEELERKVVVKR
jgi:hypothetical protein